MKQLMITPYAPYRDGIAAYAVQEVAQLRRDGHHVEVLSPLPSAAHHHLPLPSTRSMVELVKRAGAYDRVVIQFHPDLFFLEGWDVLRRQAVWASFAAIAARTKLEFRLHEIDYRNSPRDAIRRRALRAADRIVVHTSSERDRCINELGLPADKVHTIDHGGAFTARTSVTRAQARAELDLPADDFVFVSIGFIQPHKGFDRGVRALGRLEGRARTGAGRTADGQVRLYVVGDTRTDDAAWVQYCDELETLIAETPGAELRRGYVSDEQFDLWITAADRVVLPYREIWSSSVVERAGLLGTPAIVTAVGGLHEQVDDGSVVVTDDDELARAMADAAGTTVRALSVADDAADVGLGRAELQARIDAVQVPVLRSTRRNQPRRPLRSRRLSPTPTPAPTSVNPVNAVLKKVVFRLTAWLIQPLSAHLDTSIAAVTTDLATLDARIAALEPDPDDAETP